MGWPRSPVPAGAARYGGAFQLMGRGSLERRALWRSRAVAEVHEEGVVGRGVQA